VGDVLILLRVDLGVTHLVLTANRPGRGGGRFIIAQTRYIIGACLAREA
jgi:hypothetical protein